MGHSLLQDYTFWIEECRATYQYAMVALFRDMIHHEIEVYFNKMIAISQTEEEDLNHLHKLFERLKKIQAKVESEQVHFWGEIR